jgi:formylglycine-generating enzyme required for sulfatase activity
LCCLLILAACNSGYASVQVSGALRAQRSAVDGMVMVYVPAGEFNMGSDDTNSDADEHPRHTVSLDAYWIDRTEVTQAMYAACVQAAVCEDVAHPPADAAGSDPVQGVTWPNAAAYCEWVGRRLPTEAEWEKAARGTDGRIYPWGDQAPNSELGNFEKQQDGAQPVGSYPQGASPYGVLDMAGNVYEWVADWYDPDYYGQSPSENPKGAGSSLQRVLRGGNWNSNADTLRSSNRFWAFPGRNDFDGFRCALGAAS